MQRTLQTIAAFWAAAALLALIFSTMLEPMREYIEQLTITGHLTRWAVVMAPAVILYWISERVGSPTAAKH